VGEKFSKYKHGGDDQCFSVSTAMPSWMDAWWHEGQDNPCMNDLSPFAINIYRRKQLCNQKWKHETIMDIEMTKVMQWFSFYFIFNPFNFFHVLPFCQGQQPIIEWAKGFV
jgi:hypothetical protein